jgi:hypothetical protein
MTTILNILIERDGMAAEAALELIEQARTDLNERLEDGEIPHNICEEWFGLEPDYIMELL